MKAAWLKNALIGVSKPTPVAAPAQAGHYLQRLSAQPIEPALAFSQSVGVWAACRLAAVVAEPVAASDLPEVTSIETANEALHLAEIHTILSAVLEKSNVCLQHEACTWLSQNNLPFPYDLLPAALDAGQRSIALRPALLSAVGLHGQWLAQLNPQWRYAASSITETIEDCDERLWHEGNLAQREAYFKHCRTHTPDHARELLAEQLKDLPAKERLVFVNLLSTNLNQADEAFLTPLLKDRSRDVKLAAAMLLAHTPGSTYAAQLTRWMQTFITGKKGFIKDTWQCAAPMQADPAWADAALETTMPKHAGMGERAWWLYQLVRLTPLSWWTTHTGMAPHELMRWAQKTDWHHPLLKGWLESTTVNDTQWITTLLEQPPKGAFNNYAYREKLISLLAQLAPEHRQQLWEKLPQSLSDNADQLHLFTTACPLGEFLPEKFSRMALVAIARDYQKGKLKQAYGLRDQYRELACVLAPQALSHWKPLHPRDDEGNSEREWLSSFEQIIATRQKLHALRPHSLTIN